MGFFSPKPNRLCNAQGSTALTSPEEKASIISRCTGKWGTASMLYKSHPHISEISIVQKDVARSTLSSQFSLLVQFQSHWKLLCKWDGETANQLTRNLEVRRQRCVGACLCTAAKGAARASELEVLSALQLFSAAQQSQLLAWPCPLWCRHKGPPETLDPDPTFKSHELGINKPKRRVSHKKGQGQAILHVRRANLIVPKPPRSFWFHLAPLHTPWNNGAQTV